MAYYNINEIIRLTRIAKGISQEELSFDICSTVTLSGYENGKHGVRRKTYRKLMERMGRIPDLQYAVCVDKDGGLLDDRTELERAFKSYDYERAQKYLQRMKERADENKLTRQYIARAEALLDYRFGRITAEEELERIQEAVQMTVPEFQDYLQKKKRFPFVKEELLALMSLAGAYYDCGRHEEAILINEWLLYCVEAGYIGEPYKMTIPLAISTNVSRIYEKLGRYEEALEIIDACLKIIEKIDYGHLIAILLCRKAYNIIQLINTGGCGTERLDEAKIILRQAYYNAAARRDEAVMSRVILYYSKHFGKWD